MRIYEPTTAITDLILGVFSLALAASLWRSRGSELSRRYWSGALTASGVAALLGGLYHGAGPQLSLLTRAILWKSVTLSGGLIAFCLVSAAVFASFSSRRARVACQLVALAQLFVYVAWVLRDDAFAFVILNYGIAMMFVAALQLRDWRSARDRAKFILAGIAGSIAAGAVQASGVSLHQHLNHNDIYHLIQLGATYLLYRGGRLLVDSARVRSSRATSESHERKRG